VKNITKTTEQPSQTSHQNNLYPLLHNNPHLYEDRLSSLFSLLPQIKSIH